MSSADDPYNLQRFIDAQTPVYDRVCAELRAGEKQSHWMWFIFPQIAGLGFSPTSRFFAIQSLDEAKAYLAHPVLGARLRECTKLTLAISGLSALDVFGSPDDMKFRSCMTLFAQASPGDDLFERALRRYFNEEPDPQTLSILGEV